MTGDDIIGTTMDNHLHDTGGVRWTAEERLGYLNEAILHIALVMPKAASVNRIMKLVANTTRQPLPDGATDQDPDGNVLPKGISWLDMLCNMGADGATPGDAIWLTDRRTLEQVKPGWHSEAGATAIDHYIIDERLPGIAFVYPRPHASTVVWVLGTYVASPTLLTVAGDTFPYEDIYASPARNWVLHRCYGKDIESPASQARSARHFNAYYTDLGLKPPADSGVSPKNKGHLA